MLRPASTAAAREVPASGVFLDRRNGPHRALGRSRAADRRRTKLVGVAAEPLEDHRVVVHDDRRRLNARRRRAAGAAPAAPCGHRDGVGPCAAAAAAAILLWLTEMIDSCFCGGGGSPVATSYC